MVTLRLHFYLCSTGTRGKARELKGMLTQGLRRAGCRYRVETSLLAHLAPKFLLFYLPASRHSTSCAHHPETSEQTAASTTPRPPANRLIPHVGEGSLVCDLPTKRQTFPIPRPASPAGCGFPLGPALLAGSSQDEGLTQPAIPLNTRAPGPRDSCRPDDRLMGLALPLRAQGVRTTQRSWS